MAIALSPRLVRWRASPWLAHVAPLSCFLLLQAFGAAIQAEPGVAHPWWRSLPQLWLHPLQTLLGVVLVAFWWPRYAFAPLRAGQAALALGLAGLGIAVWVAPCAAGWTERTDGFDPEHLPGGPVVTATALGFRFLRLVLVAPFVEEIFWRGFLQRYLVDTREDFWEIPLGTFTWLSAFGTTAGVILIHSPADWPAAAVWGTLMAFLYLRTGSLSACVLMHAVANLLLGIYVMHTANWGFW